MKVRSSTLFMLLIAALHPPFGTADTDTSDSTSDSTSEDEDRRGKKKHTNVLFVMIDDVSTERFPESGNSALEDLLPGIQGLKDDGAIYYSHFYSPSSLCAPSQVSLFSGLEPGDIGGHHQFASDIIPGKAPYHTVPPPDVMFLAERLRSMGYWSVGAGKLDYQVADVVPTFYNEIPGGFLSDTTSYLNVFWEPALEQDRPFFGMLNMMDVHQVVSAMQREAPIPITDPETGEFAKDLPFGPFGYTTPLALLFNTGVNETARPGVVANLDLQGPAEILGYLGDFDANSLTHQNGGLPGYMPDDIGVKSILAKEYDLIRNIDYRIQKIVAKLKADGLYDDTMIVLFGDHGSATYKAKNMLQPQSVRTPLWIKYPTGTLLPKKVEDAGVDEQMTGITDLYPTVLSVLKKRPDAYMTGRALAGKFMDSRPKREMMFALLARTESVNRKTFAAFSKDFFYQTNLLTEESIEERQALGEEEEVAVIMDAFQDSLYETRFSVFAAAPLFDRMRKLMHVNALDPDYPSKYYFLTADGARPPSENFYDLRSDPDGTINLIVNTQYEVVVGDTRQKWGTNIESVEASYGPIDESGLTSTQSAALQGLREGLVAWIDTQTHVNPEVDWDDDLFGEENKMAEGFWPGGVEPETEPVELDTSKLGKKKSKKKGKKEDKKGSVLFSSPTPGAVVRHSVVSPEERSQCEQLSTADKEQISEMTIVDSGLPLKLNYVSKTNQNVYAGYLYGASVGRTVRRQDFTGEIDTCAIFVSQDATFLEIDCPPVETLAFDTRDSVWNGTDWDGVDSVTGEWTGDAVTFWDEDTRTFNRAAFAQYIYGPLRNEIFTGRNSDGSIFAPTLPNEAPLNNAFEPAPKYFASDFPPTELPPAPYLVAPEYFGAQVGPSPLFFNSAETRGQDNKGSFAINIERRIVNPARISSSTVFFDSFDYECLLWDVGDSTKVDTRDGLLHVFAQAVRKGYADSVFTEEALGAVE